MVKYTNLQKKQKNNTPHVNSELTGWWYNSKFTTGHDTYHDYMIYVTSNEFF